MRAYQPKVSISHHKLIGSNCDHYNMLAQGHKGTLLKKSH